MGKLVIDASKVNAQTAAQLVALCPFSAITYNGETLDISAACKMCRLCVRKGPAGVVQYIEDTQAPAVDKSKWQGVAVLADATGGTLHPVSFELLGKAKELAAVTGQPVMALLLCDQAVDMPQKLIERGADTVYIYEHPMFRDFCVTTYANAFEDFIQKIKPSAVLVGALSRGRSLAPRVASRLRTGLTADCTMLEMKENTDLVQIRPAFGGNIMARIITPRTRPQFCTVRYKVFSAVAPNHDAAGTVLRMPVSDSWQDTRVTIESAEMKPPEKDISEADILVAVGRGLKSAADLAKVQAFCSAIGAQLACSRPLVEAGWLDASHQIGLSGKTVRPSLIITLGISGAVQFAAGMKSADCIIAVNSDPAAPIFDVAHYAVVGDLYEVMESFLKKAEEHSHET